MSTTPLKLGVLGLGQAGQGHLAGATRVPEIEITAVGDAATPAEGVVPAGTAVYSDWRELLKSADIDAVSVCLPHFMHTEVALAAVEAGKHLLVEKPIASTVAEGRLIADAARANGRTLMVEMTHRFYTPVQAARDLVQSGQVGQIFAVQDTIVQRVPPNGIPQWMFWREKAGGGVALTNGIHMIDRLAWVCGQPLRFLAGAAGFTQQSGDVEDTASMQLELADGTAVALLAAWPAGRAPLDDELTIYGSKGTLRVRAWRGWRWEPDGGESEDHAAFPDSVPRKDRSSYGMGAALAEFAAAIRDKREPSVATSDVLAAQGIIEEFYRYTGVLK